jgi:hypothetical protein
LSNLEHDYNEAAGLGTDVGGLRAFKSTFGHLGETPTAPSKPATPVAQQQSLNTVPSSGYYCEDRQNTSKHAWLYIDTQNQQAYWQVVGYPAYRAKITSYFLDNINVVNEFGNVVSQESVIKNLWWDDRFHENGGKRSMKSFSTFHDKLDGHARFGFGFYANVEDLNPAFSAECLPNDNAKDIVPNAEQLVPPPKSKALLASEQATPTPREYQALVMQTVACTSTKKQH